MSNRLRELRVERGMTQEDAARVAGVKQATYSRIENVDDSASAEVAERLAAHFGCDVSDLFSPSRFVPAEQKAS